jgi:hypothetical protein
LLPRLLLLSTGPPPEIDTVTPGIGVPGLTDITIHGQHFGEAQGDSVVYLGNLNGIVKRWTDTKIVATVDEHAHRGDVCLFRNRQYSKAIPFTPAGLFIDAILGMPTPGNQISIQGAGFESERDSGCVTIADVMAQVSRWSTEIMVTVPDFSPTGSTFSARDSSGRQVDRIPDDLSAEGRREVILKPTRSQYSSSAPNCGSWNRIRGSSSVS